MSNLIYYALSIGLNRGVLLLLIPILASVMSVSDLASFSLYLVTGSLLIPIITLNVSAIVGREVFEQPNLVHTFVKNSNQYLFTSLILSLVILVSYFNNVTSFLFFLIAESLFLVNSNYGRFVSGVKSFFICCLSKAFVTFIVILLTKFSSEFFSSTKCILTLIGFANIIALIFCKELRLVSLFKKPLQFSFYKNNKDVLLFALALLPHSFSQWITSGSDRYIIKVFSSTENLATYSLAYSWASIFMLLNGALALGVPHVMAKNYNKYVSLEFKRKYFVGVTVFYIFTSMLVHLGISYMYTKSIYDINDLHKISQVVLAGLFILAFYYYYSTEIFYQKKSKTLSSISFITAIFNIALSILLLKDFGILGVAVATYLTYVLYYTLSLYFSKFRDYYYLLLCVATSLLVPIIWFTVLTN